MMSMRSDRLLDLKVRCILSNGITQSLSSRNVLHFALKEFTWKFCGYNCSLDALSISLELGLTSEQVQA